MKLFNKNRFFPNYDGVRSLAFGGGLIDRRMAGNGRVNQTDRFGKGEPTFWRPLEIALIHFKRPERRLIMKFVI